MYIHTHPHPQRLAAARAAFSRGRRGLVISTHVLLNTKTCYTFYRFTCFVEYTNTKK